MRDFVITRKENSFLQLEWKIWFIFLLLPVYCNSWSVVCFVKSRTLSKPFVHLFVTYHGYLKGTWLIRTERVTASCFILFSTLESALAFVNKKRIVFLYKVAQAWLKRFNFRDTDQILNIKAWWKMQYIVEMKQCLINEMKSVYFHNYQKTIFVLPRVFFIVTVFQKLTFSKVLYIAFLICLVNVLKSRFSINFLITKPA